MNTTQDPNPDPRPKTPPTKNPKPNPTPTTPTTDPPAPIALNTQPNDRSPDPSRKERVAIVTGAGARAEGIGNGRAAAILLARDGARVLLIDAVEAWAE